MDISTQSAGRDFVLDFWRGVGVLMVIIHHLVFFHFEVFKTFANSASVGVLWHALWGADQGLVWFSERSGPLGVKIFFIVSGYIITSLMVAEERKRGSLSIGAFYVRRIFRILPPFLLYLGGIYAFASAHWIVLGPGELPAAIAFLCNATLSCQWFVIHTWTLAIEMQFYFFWPLLFVFLPMRHRPLFLVFLLALLFTLSAFGILLERGWIDNALSFASIALGALCAIYPTLKGRLQKDGFLYIGVIALTGVGVYALGFEESARVMYHTATPIILATIIFSTYRFEKIIKTWVFRSIAGVGLVSYSLYLWQQVFAAPSEYYLSPSFLQYSFLMIVFSVFSYYFVEKPSIRLGKKFLEK